MGSYDLQRFALHDVTACSSGLRQVAGPAQDFAEAAHAVVRYLYEHLLDGQTGKPACALVRCFKTAPYASLSAERRRRVDSVLDGLPPSPTMPCLTLIGSAGERPEWNDASASRRYSTVPLAGQRFLAQFPMFSQLFTQLGIPLNIEPESPGLLLGRTDDTYNIFFLPNAVGSPYVPVQDEFVVPYGIRSVLGFGGVLPSRNVFVVILFTKVALARETADLFRTLALSVKLALLPHDQPGGAGDRADGSSRAALLMQEEVRTLTHLLKVQEEAVGMYAERGRRAQDALADSHAKLSAVITTSRDAVLFVDDHGRIRSWTPAAEAMFGYGGREVLNKPATVIFTSEHHAAFEQQMERGRQEAPLTVTGATIELVGQRKDGTTFPVEVMIATFRASGGPFHAVMLHDIEERLLAAARIKKSESRFRGLVEHAPDVIFTLGGDGRITSLNPAFETVTHWRVTEWIGRPFVSILHPDDVAYAEELFDYMLTNRSSVTSTFRMRSKDRGMITGEFVGAPQIEDGLVVGVLGIARDITDRKLFEEALRESEERLRAVLQSTKDAIVTIDGDGDVMFWNDGAKHLFGYNQEEMLGQPVARIVPERYREAHASGVKRAVEAGHVSGHVFEFVGLRKDGSECPVEITLASWRGRSGIFLTSVIRDITERRQTETALRESEERYALAVQGTNDGIWDWKVGAGEIYFAPRFKTLLGYEPDELRDEMEEFFSRVHPDDRARVQRAVDDHLHHGAPYHIEFRMLHKSGVYRWFTSRGQAVWDEKGRAVRMVGALTDITDRKHAELLVAESESRYRLLVQTAMEGMWLLDAEDRTEFVNQRLADLLGYDMTEIIGRPVFDFFHEEECKILRERLAARRRGVREQYDLRFRRKDGTMLWAIVSASPIFCSEGKYRGALAMVTDITERKRDEEALNALVEGTASVTGHEFFPVFVQQLAAALGVRYAFVVEVAADDPLRLRALAGWAGDRLVDPFDFDPTGLPCQAAVGCATTYFPAEIQRQFPHPMLQSMEAVSYASVRLQGSGGRNLGHLCVFHTAPFQERGRLMQLLSVFASRAAAELERTRAELALRQAESRYRSIFEHAVEGIYQTTPEGRYVTINPALARLLGYESAEAMKAAVTDIAAQVYVDATRRSEFRRIMDAKGEVTAFEAQVYRRDGSTIWISENARALRDQAGRIIGYEGTVEDITERRRAQQQLQETLKRVRTLSARLESVREEERARIARELHDELGVGLTCLKIDLTRLQALTAEFGGTGKGDQIDEKLMGMIDFVDQTIRSVQRLVVELRPGILDDLGLAAAIEWQVQDFERRTGIRCTLQGNTDDLLLDGEVATAVFRICQEALTNVARHARATEVRVSLEQHESHLFLEIADNGAGIETDKLADPHTLGLHGMRERAELFGGSLSVHSRLGMGTAVALVIPTVMNGRRGAERRT